MFERRQFLALGGGFAALVLAPAGTRAQDVTAKAVFGDKEATVLGNPQGDVSIAEYFDYQCSWCKKIHPDVMDVVEEDGKVRLLMKDWPVFGEVSIFAAQLALGAARIGKYRTVVDTLLALPGRLTPETASAAVEDQGISMDEIAEAVRTHNDAISGLLTRNWEQATAFGFRGTPSFAIGTTTYPGVLDKGKLREAIAAARG
jgi:protein-disulfide isomerase